MWVFFFARKNLKKNWNRFLKLIKAIWYKVQENGSFTFEKKLNFLQQKKKREKKNKSKINSKKKKDQIKFF